ncbi:MAG: hypothetical protein H0W25_20655 [Acidimicrobiia bacterium]|nr:hypothetical protein [Acidimicrobiia bacterium]
MRTTAARRALAGIALAAGLPLAAMAVAGPAAAQSGPSGPTTTAGASGPSGPSGPTTTSGGGTGPTVTVSVTVARPSGSGTGSGTLSRTGGEWALPLAASGGAIAVVLGGRRLSARAVRG